MGLTMEQICLYDVACATSPEGREFLQHLRLETLSERESRALATKLGFDPAEFASYARFQACIKTPEIPLELVMKTFQLQFSLEELRDYVQERARVLHEQFGDEELAEEDWHRQFLEI